MFLTLLNNRQLDTTTFGKRNPSLGPSTNVEIITHVCCKLMTSCILNMDSLKASLVLFPTLDHVDSPFIPSIDVISLDQWVRIADGVTIVGVQIWDALLSKLNTT